MYRLQDPADLKEHLCHIDELYEYRMGLTDDVVDVIALDEFEAIVHSIEGNCSLNCRSQGSWEEQVTVGLSGSIRRLRPEGGCAAQSVHCGAF